MEDYTQHSLFFKNNLLVQIIFNILEMSALKGITKYRGALGYTYVYSWKRLNTQCKRQNYEKWPPFHLYFVQMVGEKRSVHSESHPTVCVCQMVLTFLPAPQHFRTIKATNSFILIRTGRLNTELDGTLIRYVSIL